MVLKFNPSCATTRCWKDRARLDLAGPAIRQAGGYLTHMDHIWFYIYATPDYRDPAQRRGLVFRLVPGYIWVNQQGRRFHNEALSGGNSASPALMAQSPRHAWAIMDAPMTATMEVADPYYRDGDKVVRAKVAELLDNSPFIRKDTPSELAKKMEVDVGAFLTTIERYNGRASKSSRRSRNSANRSRHRSRSTRRPITPCRSFRWHARTSAASRPICNAACSTSTSSRSLDSTPRARWRAWPVATSTAAPDSKAPC